MKTEKVINKGGDTGMKTRIAREWQRNYIFYLLFIPVFLYYLIFAYKPLYGALMAFQDYSPATGVSGSPWVGFKHFETFFGSYYFGRLLKNTLTISFGSLIFGFPAPIILALLMNEIKSKTFKKTVQTVSYLPHFISLVVVCSMIKKFTMDTGVINDICIFRWGEGYLLKSSRVFCSGLHYLRDMADGRMELYYLSRRTFGNFTGALRGGND